MERIHQDLFYLILMSVPPRKIFKLSVVSKRWNELIHREEFWRISSLPYKIAKPKSKSYCWLVIAMQPFNGKNGVGTIRDYHGDITDRKCTGYGITLLNDVAFYGSYVDGMRNGFMNYYNFDMSKKGFGAYANGKPTGVIKEFNKGTHSEIHYIDGKIKTGKSTYISGNTYEGELLEVIKDNGVRTSKPNGYGVYTWKNQVRYAGLFVKGFKNGEGVIILPSEEEYPGTWCDDKRILG